MEGTPENVSIDKVTAAIKNIPGVKNIHDLHVWGITSGQNALSGHVVIEDGVSFKDSQLILRESDKALGDRTI